MTKIETVDNSPAENVAKAAAEVEKTPKRRRGPNKNANKNLRAPIGEESTYKMTDAEKIRAATGKQRRLDASHYERMPEYQGMQLFYCSDEHGEVDTWLGLGARPVPRRSKSREVFAGINDKGSSEWEYTVVDKDKSGNEIRNYLLFIPAELYQKYKLDPQRQRNNEIKARLQSGIINDESPPMPGVTGLKTYAPEVGAHQRGLQTETTHDV